MKPIPPAHHFSGALHPPARELDRVIPVSTDVHNDEGMDSTVDTDAKNFDAEHRLPNQIGSVQTNACEGDNIPDAFPELNLAGGDSRLGGNKPMVALRDGCRLVMGHFEAPVGERSMDQSDGFTPMNHVRPGFSFFIEPRATAVFAPESSHERLAVIFPAR